MTTFKKFKPYKAPKPRYSKPPTPIMQGKSKEEIAVFNMIRLEFPNLKVYESDRTILHGRELDIWIPSKSLGIEFNGLYFHNSSTKSDTYHQWKTNECDRQNIRLIQIFSDEWEYKKPLVIDYIKKALGKTKYVQGDECQAIAISQKEATAFFNDNSLIGWQKAEYYLGLENNLHLVTAIGYTIENKTLTITEYIDRRGYTVIDSLNAICKALKIKYPEAKFFKLCLDRRTQSIKEFPRGYLCPEKSSEPNTFYTKTYKDRRRLSEFGKKTETQLLNEGYVKVHDCGTSTSIMNLNKILD